ncbi:S-adenosyl methyltransferase [Tamaricihabitans halophyticus]|uniref:S-adenosyl methyltransferase n=1 Tax=Tamaricihabitans halophyticus TaxID=1262583 RepID=A0A4R2R2D0_9PSEU|nr:SAM-dependent methyltransferase [Tamaricihabitans halophyticus]TCP56890.1 S-adenosyl methyltransferase [Tamaricihabitans halophyticus]
MAQLPPGVDISRPSIARVYDYVLGGEHNFAIDRATVAELARTLPETQLREAARVARAMLVRGIEYLTAEAGIRQFLDLGSGLPTMENTHQAAQRHASDVTVCYVDCDPMVRAHAEELLTGQRSRVVTADLRDPSAVCTHPDIVDAIDFGQPVAVVLLGILHHLHDDEEPARIVREYLAAVPSGSYLMLSHFCSYGPAERAAEKAFLNFLGTGRFRTQAEIGAYFDGLDLVAPGLTPLSAWRNPRQGDTRPTAGGRMQIGAIARKP